MNPPETTTEILPLRQRKKIATRDLVVAAAKNLFEAEGGYAKATTRDIAKDAGRSTGAIFASFPDGKDELYQFIYGHAPLSPEVAREMLLLLRTVVATADGTPMKPDTVAHIRSAVVTIWPGAFDPEVEPA